MHYTHFRRFHGPSKHAVSPAPMFQNSKNGKEQRSPFFITLSEPRQIIHQTMNPMFSYLWSAKSTLIFTTQTTLPFPFLLSLSLSISLEQKDCKALTFFSLHSNSKHINWLHIQNCALFFWTLLKNSIQFPWKIVIVLMSNLLIGMTPFSWLMCTTNNNIIPALSLALQVRSLHLL